MEQTELTVFAAILARVRKAGHKATSLYPNIEIDKRVMLTLPFDGEAGVISSTRQPDCLLPDLDDPSFLDKVEQELGKLGIHLGQ